MGSSDMSTILLLVAMARLSVFEAGNLRVSGPALRRSQTDEQSRSVQAHSLRMKLGQQVDFSLWRGPDRKPQAKAVLRELLRRVPDQQGYELTCELRGPRSRLDLCFVS